MRPRAGHGWTSLIVGGKFIALLQKDDGRWITTGEARGWPRCARCRRPTETTIDSDGKALCAICYFYKTLPMDEFWRLHDAGHYLAPYNVGKRCMSHRLPDLSTARNWRSALKRQIKPTPA